MKLGGNPTQIVQVVAPPPPSGTELVGNKKKIPPLFSDVLSMDTFTKYLHLDLALTYNRRNRAHVLTTDALMDNPTLTVNYTVTFVVGVNNTYINYRSSVRLTRTALTSAIRNGYLQHFCVELHSV